jgi:hypothetical protein
MLTSSGDYVNVVKWTIVELTVAMVCSCFPAIRNLLERVYPPAFLSSSPHSDGKQPGSIPWDSNPGRKHANNGQGGFIELQHANESQVSDTPPEVPPKEPSTTTNERWNRVGNSGAL